MHQVNGVFLSLPPLGIGRGVTRAGRVGQLFSGEVPHYGARAPQGALCLMTLLTSTSSLAFLCERTRCT